MRAAYSRALESEIALLRGILELVALGVLEKVYYCSVSSYFSRNLVKKLFL